MTTEEVADVARVTPYTVRRWIRDGHLPAVTLPGGRGIYRVHESHVRALLGLDQ